MSKYLILVIPQSLLPLLTMALQGSSYKARGVSREATSSGLAYIASLERPKLTRCH